jgi:hypothetical protein
MAILLHGCAGIYSVVEFEVLEPATLTFPGGDGNLLVMNRAPVTLDSFSEEDRQGLKTRELIILDTLITANLFRGLQDVFRQSPMERFHYPLWHAERRLDTASLEDLVLTRREVETLCSEWGCDVLISLESYSMDLEEHVEHYIDEPNEIFIKYVEVSNRVQWHVHLPGSPRPFNEYTMIDTIFFSLIEDGRYIQYMSAVEMIREAFHKSGMKYGRYLVPVWSHASRTLFKGKGDSLRLASKHTSAGEWDQAYRIWEALLDSRDSTTVARSLNNMAVYYELEDKLDSAGLLVNLALDYDSMEVIRLYKDELDTRIRNRQEVIVQVGEKKY